MICCGKIETARVNVLSIQRALPKLNLSAEVHTLADEEITTRNTKHDARGRFAHWEGRPIEVRFWEKVDKNGPIPAHRPELGPCWLWTAFRAKSGYGDYTPGRAGRDRAHRWAWRLTYGPIPDDKPHVLHRCDNPPCCNPSHLFVGTHADNMADMKQKGRWTPREFPRGDAHHLRREPWRAAKGEQQGNAKLTDDKVREIRRLYAGGGWTHETLGKRYGVTRVLIGCVVRRQIWKHIAEEVA